MGTKRYLFYLLFLFGLVVQADEKSGQFIPEFSTAGFFETDPSVRQALNFNVGWRFFKGDPVRGETDGISMVPELLGLKEQQAKHAYLYWELYEGRPNCGVRMDHWKGIVKDRRNGMKMELYDLRVDEAEQVNVAEKHPLIVSQLRAIMEEAHQPNSFWDKENTPLFNVVKACSVTGVIPEPKE